MDFELLIYLAFIVIYLVFQLLAQRKKQQQSSTEAQDGSFEGTLDDALQDIRDVLGGTSPSTTSPAPPPPASERSTSVPTPLEDLTASTHDPAPNTTTADYIHDTDIPDVTLERLGTSDEGVSSSVIYRRLRDPGAAREAILISEILGAPRAHRPAPPFRSH